MFGLKELVELKKNYILKRSCVFGRIKFMFNDDLLNDEAVKEINEELVETAAMRENIDMDTVEFYSLYLPCMFPSFIDNVTQEIIRRVNQKADVLILKNTIDELIAINISPEEKENLQQAEDDFVRCTYKRSIGKCIEDVEEFIDNHVIKFEQIIKDEVSTFLRKNN